jgi:hypothetical protein
MNINIFNQIPMNPQTKSTQVFSNNILREESHNLLENFARMNIQSKINNISNTNNNQNKRAIAYNYYFGGARNSNEIEKVEREYNLRDGYGSIDNSNYQKNSSFIGNNLQTIPINNSVPNYNFMSKSNFHTPINSDPSLLDNANTYIYRIPNNNEFPPHYSENYNNEKNKYFGNKGSQKMKNNNKRLDLKGMEIYQNNKYDSVPIQFSSSQLNINNQNFARYFVVKCVDEENVHKVKIEILIYIIIHI